MPSPPGSGPAEQPIPSLPCPYCDATLPMTAFAYTTAERRLLTAACPGCTRRVFTTPERWRRARVAAALVLHDAAPTA